MSVFCNQCGRPMTGERCDACGAALPLRKTLMRQRASGVDWTLKAVRILLAICALAVAAIMLATLITG